MVDKIRILYTIPNFVTAGSGQALVNIIQRLDRGRFAPSVCVSHYGNSKLEAFLEQIGVSVLEYPTSLPPRPYHTLISRAVAAGNSLRPFNFEIWHSFHYSDDYTEPMVARFAGAKAWMFTKKNMGWHHRSWYLRALFATRIVAQNTDMLKLFFKRWPYRTKTFLVPRGVDTGRFQPQQGSGSLRRELGLSGREILVGCVAHLVPVKGHITLIQAIAQTTGTHLVLAGRCDDVEYLNQVKSLVQQLDLQDRVHFLGNVSTIPELLSEVDLVVLPTWGKWRMEGCPVALLEAMSCGKVCIATDIPGSRDIVIHGVNGWLVPPEDPRALANAIKQLTSSPELCSHLALAARKRILEQYTIEQEVAAHTALYEKYCQA